MSVWLPCSRVYTQPSGREETAVGLTVEPQSEQRTRIGHRESEASLRVLERCEDALGSVSVGHAHIDEDISTTGTAQKKEKHGLRGIHLTLSVHGTITVTR